MRLRERKRLYKRSLATRINISTKNLYEVESGKKIFLRKPLYKISRALSTADYIMSGNKHYKIPEKILDILEGSARPNAKCSGYFKSALEINTKGYCSGKRTGIREQDGKALFKQHFFLFIGNDLVAVK